MFSKSYSKAKKTGLASAAPQSFLNTIGGAPQDNAGSSGINYGKCKHISQSFANVNLNTCISGKRQTTTLNSRRSYDYNLSKKNMNIPSPNSSRSRSLPVENHSTAQTYFNSSSFVSNFDGSNRHRYLIRGANECRPEIQNEPVFSWERFGSQIKCERYINENKDSSEAFGSKQASIYITNTSSDIDSEADERSHRIQIDTHFHRALPAMGNYALLSAMIFKAVVDMKKKLMTFHRNVKRVSLKNFNIYLTLDSLYNVDWNEYNCNEIQSIDFKRHQIKFQNGESREQPVSATYDVITDESPLQKSSPLELSFSEFQYVLYKLILPTSSNRIEELIQDEESQTYTEIVNSAKEVNNYFYEYACSNIKHLHVSMDDLGMTVRLKMNKTEYQRVLIYSLPLYMAIMLALQNAIEKITGRIKMFMPDYVRLRLAFEVTANLYWFQMQSPTNRLSNRLEDATHHLFNDINRVLSIEPEKLYFLELREDRKVLVLLQLIFVEIRFSYTLATSQRILFNR